MISSVRSLQAPGLENIATPLANSPAEKRLLEYGFSVKSAQGFSLLLLRTFWRLAREIKPDIVITYGGPETIISSLLAHRLSSEFYRFRGQSSALDGFIGNALQDISHRHIRKIIVPSMAVLADQSPDCQMKSVVIPLGVDAEKYRRVASVTGESQRRPELLIFGRLDPVKGHSRFLKIFKIMLDRWSKNSPRPLLKIVGREENTKIADLERRRIELNIDRADVIYDATSVDNVAAVMTAATLGVIPSLGSELICRVSHEFLLCGTPLFVSGAGGLKEVFLAGSTHNYLGLDDEEAAKKLLYLLQDSYLEEESVRSKRAEAARNLFSIDAMSIHFRNLISDSTRELV
jgi:glycosyltransferase involved in cell wall biosynthesis